jgi:aspartate aminotransferase-like enzyme
MKPPATAAPRLWIPGPTWVRPELLQELARAQIGHRGAAMSELIARLDPGLALAFGIDPASASQVAVHTASATALMEGSLLGVGPRVLCVSVGAFGERWAEIARIVGKDVHALALPWGSGLEPGTLAAALDQHGPFDAVTLVSNETSTGAVAALPEIGRVLERFPDTRLLVDVVSYVAGAPIDFDANRIDLAFAGVQKAFALPAGITVLCASERYLAGARALARPSFYLDPVRIVDGHARRRTPATPSIAHYFALARQLDDIGAGATLPESERPVEGAAAWRARFAKHERMRERTLAWAAAHGIEPLPERRFASPTVSCLKADGLDVPRLIAAAKARGHEIGNGYGKLKNETFRIGHMGDHGEDDLEALLAALDEALPEARGAG